MDHIKPLTIRFIRLYFAFEQFNLIKFYNKVKSDN